MAPYWRLIFLKGFKRTLKGIFAPDLQDGDANDDIRTLNCKYTVICLVDENLIYIMLN